MQLNIERGIMLIWWYSVVENDHVNGFNFTYDKKNMHPYKPGNMHSTS